MLRMRHSHRFDGPNGKLFAKVREGLDKWLLRPGHGNVNAEDNPMLSTVTCSFTCRQSTARVSGSGRSRMRSFVL